MSHVGLYHALLASAKQRVEVYTEKTRARTFDRGTVRRKKMLVSARLG